MTVILTFDLQYLNQSAQSTDVFTAYFGLEYANQQSKLSNVVSVTPAKKLKIQLHSLIMNYNVHLSEANWLYMQSVRTSIMTS